MPTLEGLVFVPLSFLFFIWRPALLFPLLVISTVFEASSIVASGSIGLQPYYIVALLFILHAFLRRPKALMRNMRRALPARVLIAFLVLGVCSALVLPILFSGTPVYDPRIGIDAGLLFRPPLHLDRDNLSQAILFTINVLVVFSAAAYDSSFKRTAYAFLIAFSLIAGILFVQEMFFIVGIHFPGFIFDNNPSYAINVQSAHQSRPNGPFSEPSMAGAAVAMYCAGFLAMYLEKQRNIALALTACLACLLIGSSVGLASLAVVVALLILSKPIMRLPWYIRRSNVNRLFIFLIGGCLCASLLIIPAMRNLIAAETVNKGASASAAARFGADLYALSLVVKTHGFGVGLGSNRPSSLITSILSQLGIIGFILFATIVIRILSGVPRDCRWIAWAGLGLFLAMSAGVPDLSYPLIWVILAMAVQSRACDIGALRSINNLKHQEGQPMSSQRTFPK